MGITALAFIICFVIAWFICDWFTGSWIGGLFGALVFVGVLFFFGGGFVGDTADSDSLIKTTTITTINEQVGKAISKNNLNVHKEPTTAIKYTATSSDAKKAKSISEAIEGSNSAVRTFALNAISSKHGGNYNDQQVCDIYDKLYKSWTYVNDPSASSDYYAKASESVRLLKGDCDDYAILMASCVQAIGGSPRVILASNSGSGHAYAELYMTDIKSDADDIVKTISKRYGGKYVHYHISTINGKKQYWLNLDWSANHPGGSFYKNTGNVLIIYPKGQYSRENFNPN